ncbi:sialidase family protein [Brachyspira pilosicoli]|uniref:sialidase family protein n=1 Tax=Brachyspira pilosicoli TaxID=52584 RepID=UPI003005D774
MSKKIIYLLSLLMALSLVFASCKKNAGPTAPGGDGPNNEEDEIKNNTGGLIDSWENLKDKTIINDYAVVNETGGDYYRNPVIVALGGGNVLIITEKRIDFPGSANDIGVNGEKPVDLVYLLSTDGGDNFDAAKVIGTSSVGDATKAVSAPVVYYQRPSAGDTGKIYIIASAGAGISRTSQNYSDRNPKSQLKYIVGNINSLTGKATVSFTDWKDLVVTSASDINGKQFGTHSGRGVYKDASTLILPIITADQGANSPGTPKEMMGVVFYEVSGANGDNLTIGAKIGQVTSFNAGTPNFSVYKEAKAVEWDGSKVVYLAVPNPTGGNGKIGKGDSSTANNVTSTTIPGSEGSFGFLKLTKGWYGAGEYNPQQYTTQNNGKDEILFSHVITPAGENHMRLLDATQYQPQTKSLRIAKTGKSSSIDVLPDGTIIVAAEKERNTAASGLKFNIFFSRYTQSYLSSQLE